MQVFWPQNNIPAITSLCTNISDIYMHVKRKTSVYKVSFFNCLFSSFLNICHSPSVLPSAEFVCSVQNLLFNPNTHPLMDSQLITGEDRLL